MTDAQTPSTAEIKKSLGLNASGKPASSRRLLWLLGAVLLVGAAGGYWYWRSASASKQAYDTGEVTQASITATVSATGTIQPLTQVDIGSELSGTVKEVLVKDNALVKKGDVLVALDTTRLEAQRDRAKAQLSAAEARLAQADATAKQSQLELQRQTRLRVSGVASDQSQESALAADQRAVAAFTAAAADLQSSIADLKQVETDLAKSKLVSPINGLVMKTNVKVGQTVAATVQTTGLITLAEDLTKVQVEANVDEGDVGVVKVSQPAAFKVDAFRDKEFKGQVTRISFYPERTDGVVTYKTIIAVANDEMLLRPGMTTTAKVQVDAVESAMTVPNEALRFVLPKEPEATRTIFSERPPEQKAKVDEDGLRTVYVLRGDKAEPVKVKTGITDGKRSVIVKGELKFGDKVVISLKVN